MRYSKPTSSAGAAQTGSETRAPAIRLLILGGSTEANRLAQAIAGSPDLDAVLSLAGRTEHPALPAIRCRIGGFGGVDGLAAYLKQERIDAVVDATHPFAARISANAALACLRAGVALAAFERPAWTQGVGDRWSTVPDLAAAAVQLGKEPRRVFLTTGRIDLAAFKAASQHWYLVRTIDPPPTDVRPPLCEIILDRGPFRVDDEADLMRRHRIDVLVTKNSGAAASAAKLEAARQRGLPVVMVDRPPLPDRLAFTELQPLLSWIGSHAGTPP